ncbi:MAG: TetR/AcrR family transcriptional regulator [Thermoleophilaceae bacterium]
MRRPGRPRRESLDDEILDAALREMSRAGYARMNLESVAAAAGTTKPTLYSRFPSKAALATAALEHMRLRTPRPPLSGDVRRDLIAELSRFRAGALRPFGMSMLGTVLAEEHENPELLALFREHVITPRRQNLRRILRAARKNGQLAPDADIELGITMMVGSLYALYTGANPVRRDWPRRVVDAWLEANGA